MRALVVVVVLGLAACRDRGPTPGATGPADAREAAPADAAPPPPPLDAATPPPPIDTPVTNVTPPCPKVVPRPPKPIDRLTLTHAKFSDLEGWADDRLSEAIPAFLASCGKLAALADDAWVGLDHRFGRARQWRHACATAAALPAGDDRAARRFFETELAPWQAAGRKGPKGKMTAYFVQQLRASRTQHDQYQFPIYRRPPEVVMIDMAACSPTGRGRKHWGKLDPATGAVVPLPTRGQIRAGAFAGRNLELLWSDDPVDVLFLAIQGSGYAVLDDGSTVWVEYDGKNGQAYAGPARLLRQRGLLPRGQGTMQGIRAQFAALDPAVRDEIIDGDESMVFFKLGTNAGAVGSQGVVLTPQRSVAVDRNFIAASTPLWIDTTARKPNGAPGMEPYRRVMVAQDTGGNIKGAVRADLYWGPTAADGEFAGRFGGGGRYWVFLPKAIKPRR